MKTASKGLPSFSVAIDPVTGIGYTSQYDIFTVGAGYLDVMAALNNSDALPAGKTALSPTASHNPATGRVDIVYGSSVAWGLSVAWGTSVCWGTTVFVNGTSVAGLYEAVGESWRAPEFVDR